MNKILGFSFRTKTGAASVSILSNSVLVVLKLLVGMLTGSVSIISEAAHSAVDLLAALIAYLAVANSDKKPDRKHTYGHGKIENLSGAIEALLIIFAAIWIIYEAVQQFSKHEAPQYLEYGIGIMLISTILNYFVSKNLMKVAKATQSQALEADALHLQSDIWTGAGVLIGLIAIKLTGLYWLDPVIALLVALIIFKAGYSLTKKNIYELLDVALPEAEQLVIRKILDSNSWIKGYKHIHSRRSGSKRLIELYILIDGDLPLKQAHLICDEIENELKAIFSPCEVTIHPEPFISAEATKAFVSSENKL